MRQSLKPLILFIALIAFFPSVSCAEITWDIQYSRIGTPGAGVTLQFAAIAVSPTELYGYAPGFGGKDNAYGVESRAEGAYSLNFNIQAHGIAVPTVSQSELATSRLIAGEKLSLSFNKGINDRIDYIIVSADRTQPIYYTEESSTDFTIHFTVANPPITQGVDVGAAVGVYIDYSSTASVDDFGGTLFVSDLHFLSLGSPSSIPKNTAAVSVAADSGVTPSIDAFIPLPFATATELTRQNGALALGYIDGVKVDSANFQNSGLDSSLGFVFFESSNLNNTVLKLSVTNSPTISGNYQFGRIDTAAPSLKLTGKARRTVTTSSATLVVTATDDFLVSKVEYSLISPSSGFKKATLKSGNWKVSLKNLLQGRTKIVYVRAIDVLGKRSKVTKVYITRS